jgi:hypothetical protein
VDGDGLPELVTGDGVWEWPKGGKKWVAQVATGQARGHVAIADFGTFGPDPAKDDRSQLDGLAEVAAVTSGQVRVQTIAGRVVFGPVGLPGGGVGGTPTIGDFDQDGRVEVADASLGSYTVFDPDCNAKTEAKTCPTLAKNGILWSQPSQDHSSSSTGSSVFDFDGDGKAEAIYADECFARVYDGASGEVIYSQYHTSCTWYENPIVADVDGDFKSELVVPSNTNCSKYADCKNKQASLPGAGLPMDSLFKGLRCQEAKDCPGGSCGAGFCRCQNDAECGAGSSYRCGPPIPGTPGAGNVCRSVMLGPVAGIRIYGDVQDRWVDSRPIWNQHAYSITHVDDSGFVPRTSLWTANWLSPGLNNYRQNAQGSLNASAVPDLTVAFEAQPICQDGSLVVGLRLCNRGTKPVGAGAPVAVWLAPAKPGDAPACKLKASKILSLGACEKLTCVIPAVPPGKLALSALADWDGSSKGANVECWEGNNGAGVEAGPCS